MSVPRLLCDRDGVQWLYCNYELIQARLVPELKGTHCTSWPVRAAASVELAVPHLGQLKVVFRMVREGEVRRGVAVR